jgi:hypothetical protein
MASNPLKWPSFEQLGRDFYDNVKPCLDQLENGSQGLDSVAHEGLAQLKAWLDAPCVATVKLDGTNVGVDNEGLIVGRNTVVPAGQAYQKVDVQSLLSDVPAQAESLRVSLDFTVGVGAVAQVMLYGELVVNKKFDYDTAGIFKQWLCFGAIARPASEDEEAASRLATALRAAGFNTQAEIGKVVLAPNAKLVELLHGCGVRLLTDVYWPNGAPLEHDGSGTLPTFRSLRQLILSEWAQRVLAPVDGMPLAEGLVLASATDGRFFKWKNAGEELGKVPDQLRETVARLLALSERPDAQLLLRGLLEVFERLLLVATPKPKEAGKLSKPGKAPAEAEARRAEARAVWESALTKFDDLEAVFAQGAQARQVLEEQLIKQISSDLAKDYGAGEKDAVQRATATVRSEVGKRFGTWKKSQSAGGA